MKGRRGKCTYPARTREGDGLPACPEDELERSAFLDRSVPENLHEVGDRVLSLCGIQPETWRRDAALCAEHPDIAR